MAKKGTLDDSLPAAGHPLKSGLAASQPTLDAELTAKQNITPLVV